MYELGLFKSFLIRDNYIKYRNYVREEDIAKDLQPILAAIDYYYKGYTDPPSGQDLENILIVLGAKKAIPSVKAIVESGYSQTSIELLGALKRQRLLEELAIKAVELSENG